MRAIPVIRSAIVADATQRNRCGAYLYEANTISKLNVQRARRAKPMTIALLCA